LLFILIIYKTNRQTHF